MESTELEKAKNNLLNYTLTSRLELTKLAGELLSKYSPERFQEIRLKFFVHERKPMVAFYAVVKLSNEMKKIKIMLSFPEFVSRVHKIKESLYM